MYIYINFKAIYQKIVFKTYLFSTNISLSLQKLRQYNKKSQERQTKIKAAITTN